MARNPFTAEKIDAALDDLKETTVRIDRYPEASGGPWLFRRRLTLDDLNVAPYVVRFEEERPGRLRQLTDEWWRRLTCRPSWRRQRSELTTATASVANRRPSTIRLNRGTAGSTMPGQGIRK